MNRACCIALLLSACAAESPLPEEPSVRYLSRTDFVDQVATIESATPVLSFGLVVTMPDDAALEIRLRRPDGELTPWQEMPAAWNEGGQRTMTLVLDAPAAALELRGEPSPTFVRVELLETESLPIEDCYAEQMRLAAIVLMLCGCGRFGFEGGAGDGGGAIDATDGAGPDGSCTWGPWSAPTPVEGFEGSAWERSPAQRTDRLEMVFARYEVVNSQINAQIWSATRTSMAVPYGPGSPVVELNDLLRDDLDASLSANGLVLIFASDRTGTRRAFEARRPTVGAAFSSPVLAAGIGPLTLYGPELTADGLGLYFTVVNDLWVARRATLGQGFQSPTQLGFTGDQASVSADEREIYFLRSFKLFVRARPSIADPFADEVEVELVVPGFSGTGSPDLSDDGAELLIILNDQLSRLTRTCD